LHSHQGTHHQNRKLISKHQSEVNNTLDEMSQIDIHPNAEEYTFFSSAHETFSRIDHILGHKSNLSKFNKIEIVSSIFPDHNAKKKKNCKKHKHIEIKQHVSKYPESY